MSPETLSSILDRLASGELNPSPRWLTPRDEK
jgi:hypothetical protein